MNRILYTLLFILSCGYAFGQTTTNYQTWYKFNYKVSGDSVYAHTAFYAPVRDTSWTPTQIGAIVFKSTNQTLYVCTALTGQKWTALGGGGGTYTAGYGLILSSPAFRVDTSVIGSKSFVQGMPAYGITSTHINLWNTAYSWGNHTAAGYATQAGLNDTAAILRGLIGTGGSGSPGDTYNTHDTLTQSRLIDLNDAYGLTFTIDGTNDIATGINASGFTSKRSKHDFTANNGWIYGQLHDPAQEYKSRFQVIGLVNDSTHSAQLISTNNNNYNKKAALVSAAWWEGAKLQANVNWKSSGSTTGYKGLYVTGGDGLGVGTLKIDGEVLGVGTASDSALVWDAATKEVKLVASGGGGASYTPTITTASTSQTLSTDYETWVFTGASAATFTLPATGTRYVIKSRGTGTLTVSGTLYTTSAQSSLTLYPGEALTLQWDGTYWIVY